MSEDFDGGGEATSGDPEASTEASEVAAEGSAELPGWAENLGPAELEVLHSKGFKSPGEALRHLRDLEATIGPDMVQIPGDDASAEARQAFWNRLGRPDTAQEYKLEKPDGVQGYDLGSADWFRETAHELNLPAETARELHDRFVEHAMEQSQTTMEGQDRGQAQTEAVLQRDWGHAYDERMEQARRTIAQFGGQRLKEAMDRYGAGDDPVIVRAFAEIGRRLYGGGMSAEAGDGVMSPSQARREIMDLRADDKFMAAYAEPSHPDHATAMERMAELYAAAHPGPGQ